MFYFVCLIIFAINLSIAIKYKNIKTDNLTLDEYIKSKFELDNRKNEDISSDIFDFDKFNNIWCHSNLTKYCMYVNIIL